MALTLIMDISVIICTYNRCESLRQTLQTCCDLVIPEGVTWELLVVDNNSTDNTKQICEEFTGKLPLRYSFEPRQGLSCARNRSIREATGELLFFTDDDVDVDKYWLSSIWDGAQRHPEAVFFGGRVLPSWEKAPPDWVQDHLSSLLKWVLVYYNQGDAEHALIIDGPTFYGANLVFRKKVFAVQSFREDIGRRPGTLMGGEDNEIQQSLMKENQQGFYLPTAIVHHRTPWERTTERYVRKWFVGQGTKTVRVEGLPANVCYWFNTPRYLWRQLIASGIKYLLTRCTCPSRVWLPAEIQMARTWGAICESRRLRRNQCQP